MEIASPEVLIADTSFLGHFDTSRRSPERYGEWPSDTLDRIAASQLAITPFTLAEVRYGYRRAGWGPARVAQAEHTLAGYVLIPLDEATLDAFVDLKLWCEQAGTAMGAHDCWIAATAVSREIPLVSCDRVHCDLPGLDTIFLEPPLAD